MREALTKRFGDKPLYAPSGTAMSALEHEIDSGWLPYIKAELAKVEIEQAAIDSPEEYARLGKACGGEIATCSASCVRARRPADHETITAHHDLANPTSTDIEAPPRYFALIPAAGVGARMAAGGPNNTCRGRQADAAPRARRLPRQRADRAHLRRRQPDGGPRSTRVLPPAGVTVLRCGGATRMDSRAERACARCAISCTTTTGCWCTTPRVPA